MREKSLKKCLAFGLCAVLGLSMYATPVFAETAEVSEQAEDVAVVSGTSGALNWQIDAKGTLKITGNGNYTNDSAQKDAPAWTDENFSKAVVEVSGLTNMENMFADCHMVSEIDFGKTDTSKVENMAGVFSNCTQLKKADVGRFKTGNVTTMAGMFYDCYSLQDADVSHFDTSQVEDMSNMFALCGQLTNLDVSHFDTGKVEDMTAMFHGCSGISSLDVTHFKTNQVSSLDKMFSGCSNLKSLDVSFFNTENVESFNSMFANCEKLTSLDLTRFDTKNLRSMANMFDGCSSITELDFTGFDLSKVVSVEDLFTNCAKLRSIKMPAQVTQDINLPNERIIHDYDTEYRLYGTWKADNDKECSKVIKELTKSVTYTRTDKTEEQKPVTPTNKEGVQVASYQGNSFYKGNDGKMRCYDKNGNLIKNQFVCDGTYTYYFQADGTAMTDRLTYHPDGVHVIYLDANGHEVFSNFTNVKKSIAGTPVDDLCFFDVHGYMYVDVVTFDQTGKKLYYANQYGVMERKGWFKFSPKQGGGTGYANTDGTLKVNQFAKDAQGRDVYFKGDGRLATGLITDGAYYYRMDETDGHCIEKYPVK